MKYYGDIICNESGFKFRFYSLFWRGPPPPGKLWENYIKMVYSERILGF